MSLPLYERADFSMISSERLFLRRLIPLGFVAAALLLDLVALPARASSALMPSLTLCAMFFWSLKRPDLITPLTMFLLGLALDLLAGLPVGFSSFTILIAIKLFAAADREFIGGHFVVMWGCFVLTALLMFLSRWLVATLFWGFPFALGDMLLEAAVTIAVFPLAAWLGNLAEPRVPRV